MKAQVDAHDYSQLPRCLLWAQQPRARVHRGAGRGDI